MICIIRFVYYKGLSCTHTLRLILLDYKQMIKNLVFFFPPNGVNIARRSNWNSVRYFAMRRYEIIEKMKVKSNCWTRPWIKRWNVFGAHHALLEQLRREDPNSYKNFPSIYSFNLLLPMQQQAFPHQYLISRLCFASVFIMVLMQMCNP
jgi:hypothetical protein